MSLLTAVGLALAVSPAHAESRNVISRISVTDTTSGTRVRIEGSRAPSFTQFTLTSPDRVVIDLSGAVLAGPAAEIPGTGTIVRSIRTAMFESKDVSVARVTLEFSRKVTYDIGADGTALVVGIRPTGGAAVASAGTGRAARALADANRRLAEATRARQAAEARADAEAKRLQAAEAARDAAEAKLAAADKQDADASTVRAALAQAQAEAKAADARRAEAETKAQEEAKARAVAEQKAQDLATQRAAAEKKAADTAHRLAQAEAEAKALREHRVVADARTGVEPGQRYALAQYENPENAGPAVSASAPKVMQLVGFRQKDKTSEVFIRTNEPARYSVNESGDTVIVDVENTRARTQNDLNFLDTRFFDSAVARIDPQEIEGAGTHIRISIELKQHVPYEVKQVDNEIRIDFRRPGK